MGQAPIGGSVRLLLNVSVAQRERLLAV